MTTSKTTAEKISNLYRDDGQFFQSEDGVDIEDACVSAGATKSTKPGTTDTVKYSFPDGSAIVISGDCWDFPLSDEDDCFCLAESNQHDSDCRHHQSSEA